MKFTIKPTLFILAALLSNGAAHALENPYATEFETKSVRKDVDTIKARKKLAQRFSLLKAPAIQTKNELAAIDVIRRSLDKKLKEIRSNLKGKTTFEAATFDAAVKKLNDGFSAVKTEIKKNS
jgi:hypothetical protein